MNWSDIRSLSFASAGVFLALLIVASAPNFGLKHGMSAALPSALLCFMGIWLLWKKRGELFAVPAQRRWGTIALLLFIPILISVPASYDVRYSASVAAAMVLYYFTGAALIHAMHTNQRRAWLAKWIVAVLLFWLADSLIQYLFGRDLFGIAITPDSRVTGPFEGNLRQATFLAMLMPVAMAYLLPLKRGWLWTLLFFTTAATIALMSGVRMVLVMLAIVVAGIFLHLPRSRWKWPLLAALPVIAAVAIALSPTFKQRMSTFTAAQTLDFATVDTILSNRATIWETGGHMMLARPFTGVGAGAFEKAYKDFATRPNDVYVTGQVRVHHAHQVYVSFAAETGITGLAALIAALLLSIRWYWQAPRPRRLRAWPYALALMAYFFPVNTQPPLFSHWLFPVLLLLFAAMLAALDDATPDKPVAQPL